MMREPIHPWRWRAVSICFLVLGIATFLAIRDNRNAISQVRDQKANIIALERTNCGLRTFLGEAGATRRRSGHRELVAAKYVRSKLARARLKAKGKADLAAARGYFHLRKNFTRDECAKILK